MGLIIRKLPEPYKSMALANQKSCGNPIDLDKDVANWPEDGGFEWKDTPEGEDFWSTVYNCDSPEIKTKAHYPKIFPDYYKINQIVIYLPTMGIFEYRGYKDGKPLDCKYLNKSNELSLKPMEITEKNFTKFRSASSEEEKRFYSYVNRENFFKEGDTVRCIDNSKFQNELELGGFYTVLDIDRGKKDMISVRTKGKNNMGFYKTNRFIKVDNIDLNTKPIFNETSIKNQLNTIKNGRSKENIIKINRPLPTVSRGKRPSGSAIRGRTSRVTTESRRIIYNSSVIKS